MLSRILLTLISGLPRFLLVFPMLAGPSLTPCSPGVLVLGERGLLLDSSNLHLSTLELLGFDSSVRLLAGANSCPSILGFGRRCIVRANPKGRTKETTEVTGGHAWAG